MLVVELLDNSQKRMKDKKKLMKEEGEGEVKEKWKWEWKGSDQREGRRMQGKVSIHQSNIRKILQPH